MPTFISRILIFIAVTVVLAVLVRFGLRLIALIDKKFVPKTGSAFNGFAWFFRLPGKVGDLAEYYFYFLLGSKDFFSRRAWPIKVAGLLSLLLYIAYLLKGAFTKSYLSFEYFNDDVLFFLHTGFWGWYLNTIVSGYLALVTLVTLESTRMKGLRAPLRVLSYLVLTAATTTCTFLFMASLLVAGIIYIVIRFILSLFLRSRIVGGESRWLSENLNIMTFTYFRQVLKVWEDDLSNGNIELESEVTVKKPPLKKKTVTKEVKPDSSIPKAYPD